jgi:hypothetical protein
MARIPKTKVYNPQKAEAYVGKRVLKNGDTLSPIKGAITPVPNGPLIKKDGTSLKNGGSTPAWQRKEGKNPSGGLNAKGRASYNRANPGSNLKAPQPGGGARKRSFCARMSGVKGPAKKPNGEPTRKTLALRKWKC